MVSGLLLISTATASEHGTILLYHHVALDTPPSTTISPQDFRAHLEYLRDHDYTVIALPELIDALRAREALPEKAVAITFDDGYLSIYEQAFPMLQEFGYPFTLFVSTGPINNRQPNYMTWEQIREMSAAGVTIANHMVEHPYMLERIDNESDAQWIARLQSELLEAEETIRRETGQQHRLLAYPYGEFDDKIKAMIAAQGFVGLAQNSGAVGYYSDFLALPRYPLASIYANLDTAATKFGTLAFNVQQIEPTTPVTQSTRPSTTLQFAPGDYNFSQIGCFADSEPLAMNWLDRDAGLVELTPQKDFNGRRWRYICTAPDPDSARYYWYSVQWINPDK